MVFIRIDGADQYLAMEFSQVVEPKIVEELKIKEDDIAFICPECFFVHKGQEQTSFHTLLTVKIPTKYKSHEKKLAEILFKELNNLTVHSHILFEYFDEKEEYDQINGDYPTYMDSTNMVKAEQEEDEETTDAQQPYMGNVFEELDNFVAKHPEMTKDQATEEFYKEKKSQK